ncbi:MAG: hypothetical protein FJX73_03870 [Armatimonadetes bacterium]|nr:hypothetical protein [Armatimonadota bacterium]
MKRQAVVLALLLVPAMLLAGACGRGDRLGDIPYFPGSTHVGRASSVGEAHGFPRSKWEQIELRSTAPYDQVREFYAKLTISGWTSTFESEIPKSAGSVYYRFLADAKRRQFYVITVEERQASRTVTILLRRGLATTAPR